MHQYRLVTDIISMEILNLEIICCLRAFQQLMLNLFDNDILAIEHDEDITSSEVNCACPTLFGDIERVFRRTGQGFALYCHMNPLSCFVPESLNYGFERCFTRLRIVHPYKIANLDVLNGYISGFGCNTSAGNKALNPTELLSTGLSYRPGQLTIRTENEVM